MDKSTTGDFASASLVKNGGMIEGDMMVSGRYTIECRDAQGNLKWEDAFDNLVTYEGRAWLLDQGLAGTANAVSVYASYITSGTPVVGDTYATHAGFVEAGAGVVAARTAVASWSAASPGASTTKSPSAAISCTCAGSGTIIGIALNVIAGAAGATGTVANTASGAKLYSAGTFTSKSVSLNDVLNVTYTTTLA